MAEMQAPAGEAVIRLLEEGNPSAYPPSRRRARSAQILRHPDASVACDCGATTSTTTHSRNYGTFPRVLGRYVRDEKVLALQDAVRKMSALPAATIGMIDRGRIAVGMMADIAVFDPKTIIDHATYDNPAAAVERRSARIRQWRPRAEGRHGNRPSGRSGVVPAAAYAEPPHERRRGPAFFWPTMLRSS